MKKKKKAKLEDKYVLYIRKIFARNLKKLRSDRHLSQMELASISDLSTNFINEIENEKKWPSIASIARLVRALSVEPVHFFAPETIIFNDTDMLKAELSTLITAIVNERIERYASNSPIGPDANKPGRQV